ncbi:MAG TPA: 50S ribosomal protein L28 [bacterium]|mgnify:CR=1 FL=1|nr:50S ribosomal protein L28 [bacterium]HNS33859.1 50S ribosomal protein L28 [bacterium]HNZ73032.1 50S ribosomal protein L28 [bacterium]HOH67128.1 50S ribosomal protein L28 [bacterium]HPN80979.1 50S ribosomal protein L28 [bacterium]
MPQICEICGRGTKSSFNVSHSKVKTKTTQKINIQTKKIGTKKIKICTSCLKTANK